ncbi:unnamed protein product [Rhizophagus irregularis]|uniref:Uncharacterized protein n=1 Tax=Rhizophagus irregularis TaxID=588596 RepID=A0A916A161_9GLOM|nr:unnamed protein product [Rhizophagus irregularis]CAB5322578.1 unnamed protein product [Rhizophagus irregularis]CAB5394888.1 unnamed protein product [Rhizophagus irregularis]
MTILSYLIKISIFRFRFKEKINNRSNTSFEEQHPRDERAEYIISPQYFPPHIQQLTNERDSTAHYSLPISMPLSYDNNNYDCIIPTTQYTTSCSIPMQQHINDDSISQYSSQPSTLTQPFNYNDAETQQFYDKNPQQPFLNLPLPCEDSNIIFRFEIPGLEIIINPSTFTNDYIIDDPNSQYSSQPQHYIHSNDETHQIYDKNQHQPILNPSFPHDNLHVNSHTYRFDIPGFNITINPST